MINHYYLLSYVPLLLPQAIGEPPLFLAASVFYAIKAAVRAARAETGHHATFSFDSPATAERIRMACEDQFTQQVINISYIITSSTFVYYL